MKMTISVLDAPIPLSADAVTVLRIQDRTRFGRLAQSAMECFPDQGPINAALFSDEGKELKIGKEVLPIGSIVHLDLEKLCAASVLKDVVRRLTECESLSDMRQQNEMMEESIEALLSQMAGDYALNVDWDPAKYLKMMGLGVDCTCDRTLSDKAQHLARVASDLFCDKVLLLIDLGRYMSAVQYADFCEAVIANGLRAFIIEQGDSPEFSKLENGIYVDSDYLETTNMPE